MHVHNMYCIYIIFIFEYAENISAKLSPAARPHLVFFSAHNSALGLSTL